MVRELESALHYHAVKLGNLNRSLELVDELLRSHPRSHALKAELPPFAREIVSHLPHQRRPAALLTGLQSILGDDLAWPDAADQSVPGNAVIALLVDGEARPSGLVRDFWVAPVRAYEQRPARDEEVSGEFRKAVFRGCAEARRELERIGIHPLYKLPEDYDFHVEPAPLGANPQLAGGSIWLAAALSYFALCSGLPLPGPIAASGSEPRQPRATVSAGDLRAKLSACLRERPDTHLVVVLAPGTLPTPWRNDSRVKSVRSFAGAVRAIWGPQWRESVRPPKLDFYAAMHRAMYCYEREHDLRAALERFRILQRFLADESEISQRYDFLCAWKVATAYTHLWQLGKAARFFETWRRRATALLDDGTIDAEDYAGFFASYAVYLLRRGKITDAIDVLRPAVGVARRFRAPRASRSRLEATYGRGLAAAGRFRAAERHLLRAYDLCDNEEKPKKGVHLARLYLAWNRPREAQQWIDRSRALNDQLSSPLEHRINAWHIAAVQARLEHAAGDAMLAAEENEALRDGVATMGAGATRLLAHWGIRLPRRG